jgi:hypothetical protein
LIGKGGLITPNRTKLSLKQNFNTAYGFTEAITDKVIVANVTAQPIRIKQNSNIGELHVRNKAFEIREGEKQTTNPVVDNNAKTHHHTPTSTHSQHFTHTIAPHHT